MKYIVFGLLLGIGFVIYSAAVIRTGYDRKVDDEQQERFVGRHQR